MKILALDSSGLVASVAVMEDDTLVAEYTMNYKKTHSQTLLPMLDEIKNNIQLDLNSIDAIAVAAGPGSFTGLRIGSAIFMIREKTQLYVRLWMREEIRCIQVFISFKIMSL